MPKKLERKPGPWKFEKAKVDRSPGGSGLLGGGQQPPTVLNGIRTNEALLGTPLPIIIGQQRASWKLLWYGAFKSWQASQGGSGLTKGGSSYVYSASVLGAVCMGPCINLLAVWSSNGKFAIISYSETYVISGVYTYTPANSNFFVQDFGVGFQANYQVEVNDFGSPGATTYSGTQQVPLTYTTNPSPADGEYAIVNNPSIGPFVLSSVDTNGNYQGTITGGDNDSYVGFGFDITGFSNNQNNVVAVQCIASTETSLSLAVSTIPEVNAASAVVQQVQYVFNPAQNGKTVVITYVTYRYHIDEDELDIVPSSPPYQVTVQNQNGYYGDTGVFYYPSGVALRSVSIVPTVTGTYNPNGGNYLFASGDSGQGVVITYLYNDPNYDKNDPTGKLNLTFYGGGLGQSAWPYLTDTYPSAALGYSEVCYVASAALYLGFTPVLPQMNFEVLGPYSFGNGVPDACPADAIYGLLTSPEYKYNFPVGNIDVSLLEGNSSAKAQWVTNNFFISAILDSQSALMNTISNWCEAGQVYIAWDEGLIKFIPLVDTTTVGNGLTYYPPTQPIIDLDDNDFVRKENEDPIVIDQTPWQSRWNRVSIRWAVRVNSYNQDILQIQDEAAILQYGLMSETPKSYEFICTEAAAQFAANMRLQRLSAIYTTYKFTLTANMAFLSVGDIVTITDGLLGQAGTLFGRTPCRLIRMTDDPVQGIICEAENFPWSVGTSYLYNKQAQIPSNTGDGPQEDPGDTTAVIIEIPNEAAQFNGDTLYIFGNGANVNWGGFQLWVSFDGIDYRYYNQYTTEGKIGLTTADYPLHSDPDLSNTLTVDMQQSGAVLQSVSNSAWDSFTTASALLSPGQAFQELELAASGTAVGSVGGSNTASQGPFQFTATTDLPAGIGLPWTNPNGILSNSSYASRTLTRVSGTLAAGVYLQGSIQAYFYNSASSPQGAIRFSYPISTTPGAQLGFGVFLEATAVGNSLMFNTPPSSFSGASDPNVHPIKWATIRSDGAITGFTIPYLGDKGQSYFTVLVGTFYIPVAGSYPITISHDDGLLFAISGASIVSAVDPGNPSSNIPSNPFAQTRTLVMGYSFPAYTGSGGHFPSPNPTFLGGINGQGFHPENYVINFPSPGFYQFEIDWMQLSGPQVLGVYSGATSSSPWSATTITPATASQNFSDFLVGEGAGFSVPTGSNSIIAVQVNATSYATVSNASTVPMIAASLVFNGSQLGVPINLVAGAYPTSPTNVSVGNLTSLSTWNLLPGSLTPAIVNDPSFGVQFQALISGTVGNASTLNIQNAKIIVVWETAGTVIGWTNPQNVSSNVSYATATFTSDQNLTQWLYSYNFGYSLPFGFILAGITVTVNAYTTASAAQLTTMLVSNEQRIGAPKAILISNSASDYTFGASSDDWGAAGYWNVNNLNAQGIDGFGTMMQVEGAFGDTVHVNNVRITLYGTSVTNLEFVAFETATLVGQNTYALTSIHRGILGTFPCDHPPGSVFAELNQATIIYQVPAQYIGSTIYFKLLSFNAYGYQLQNLSDVTAYAVPIQGLGPGAIDSETGALLTGTPNFEVTRMESAFAAVHGPFGIQNIPSGYALVGPVGQLSGTPQWQNVQEGAGGGVNDIYIYIPTQAGLYGPNQELYYSVPVRSIILPVGLIGTHAGCRQAPTTNVSVTLFQNNTTIGTVNFTAASTVPLITFSNAISFNGTTDSFSISAPASVDRTFAGFWVDIFASRIN